MIIALLILLTAGALWILICVTRLIANTIHDLFTYSFNPRYKVTWTLALLFEAVIAFLVLWVIRLCLDSLLS